MRRSPRLMNKRSLWKQQRNPWSGQSASALVAYRIVNSTYPVCIELSGEVLGSLRREPATKGSRGCSTGLSSVHWTVWAMVGSNDRLLQTSTVDWRGQGTRHVMCAPDCLVRPTTKQSAFRPTARIMGEVINTRPTSHLEVWEPKQYIKTYCRLFQVLLHPSA
jgi:hypothetical protein